MDLTNVGEVMRYEGSVKVGDSVIAYWTNSNRYYRGLAMVVKVNQESFVVELTEAVPTDYEPYPIGNRIKCPRLTLLGSGGKVWSGNNRIGPTAVDIVTRNPAMLHDAITNAQALNDDDGL